MSPRTLLFCSALYATAALAEPESRCRVDTAASGAVLELELEGVLDDDFPDRCRTLAALVALPGVQTATSARRAEERLLETTYFRQADCLPEGAVLRCRLLPNEMVASSEVNGALPFVLLRGDLERRVFLQPGVLVPDARAAFRTQAERLETYLNREGYFDSQVQVRSSTTTGAEPNVSRAIDVDVDTGPTLLIREIKVVGDAVLTDDDLATFRHHWFFFFFEQRFRPAAFEETVDGLTDRLRARGYPEAVVRGSFRADIPARAVDVELTVESGPKVEVVFNGNRVLSDEALLPLATFQKAGSIDAIELDATAQAVRRRYQERGFYAALVEPSARVHGKRATRVSLDITEGPRAFLSELSFSGNYHLSQSEIGRRIDLYLRTAGVLVSGAWVDEWAAHDAKELVALYAKQGFGAAEVKVERSVKTDGSLLASFNVVEGPLRLVSAMTISGLPPEVDAKELRARLALVDHAPYADALLGPDRREIVAALAAAGYPRAEVRRKLKLPYKDQEGSAEISYVIEPGAPAIYGGLLVQGNIRTSGGVIEDQLGLSVGEPLSSKKLAEAKRRLRNLGVFGAVELKPLGLGEASKDTFLLVSVEERARRSLYLVLSFSTSDYLAIGADYLDRNLFGRAISLDLQLRFANASELGTVFKIGERDLLTLRLRAPRVFGSGFDLETQGFYDLVDHPKVIRERRVGVSLAVLRTLLDRGACPGCPGLVASLAYELTATETAIAPEADPSTLPVSATDAPATFGRLVPRLSLDTRDTFVDPRAGIFAEASFELANQVFAGPFYEGARNFWRFLLSSKVYVPLGAPLELRLDDGTTVGGPFVLALAARYGVAHPYGSRLPDQAPIPLSETFAYGGDVSVRGLDDSASKLGFPGANYLFTGSLEFRWYALQNFGFGSVVLAGFADFGAVSYHVGDLFGSPTFSAGPILRYVTPIGPLAVAYGFALLRPPEIVTANPEVIPIHGRLHVSFGATF